MWTKWLKRKRHSLTASAAAAGLSLGLCALPVTGFAAGAAGIVYDPTNFAQNLVTAVQSVVHTENQMSAYLQDQFGIDINLKNLGSDQVKRLLYAQVNKLSDQANQQFMLNGRPVINFARLLNQYRQQAGLTQNQLDQQYSAYAASDLTPQQYVDEQLKMSKLGGSYAAAGFQQAQQAMETLNQQAGLIQKQSSAIGTMTGQTQNMQLMQSQLSLATKQNQQLLKLISARAEIANNGRMKGAVEEQKKIKQADAFNKRFGWAGSQ